MTTTEKIERLRELIEQAGRGFESDELELIDLISDLDKAGALIARPQFVHVVEVFDRTDGIYVFADPDDAKDFEDAVNGDRDVSLGSNCSRNEEIVIQHADAHVVIDAEREE
jgi:hypothetical protein